MILQHFKVPYGDKTEKVTNSRHPSKFHCSIHNVSDIELNIEFIMWLASSCLIVQ